MSATPHRVGITLTKADIDHYEKTGEYPPGLNAWAFRYAISEMARKCFDAASEKTRPYDVMADAVNEIADAAAKAFMDFHGLDVGCWDSDNIVQDVKRGIVAAIEQTAPVTPSAREHRSEETAMLLAAISTACGQNTRESAKDRVGRDNPYWTPAYEDACRAVDREMDHREENERLRMQIGYLAGEMQIAGDRRSTPEIVEESWKAVTKQGCAPPGRQRYEPAAASSRFDAVTSGEHS